MGGSSADYKLSIIIVRPSLLSTLATFGSWMDGRITCWQWVSLSVNNS